MLSLYYARFNKVEEEIVFSAMSGIKDSKATIDQLVDEHRKLENLVQRLQEAGIRSWFRCFESLADLLEAHIRMEERFSSLATNRVSPPNWPDMWASGSEVIGTHHAAEASLSAGMKTSERPDMPYFWSFVTELILVDLVIKRYPIDLQQASCLGDIPTRLVQYALDVLRLQSRKRVAVRMCLAVMKLNRQVVGLDFHSSVRARLKGQSDGTGRAFTLRKVRGRLAISEQIAGSAECGSASRRRSNREISERESCLGDVSDWPPHLQEPGVFTQPLGEINHWRQSTLNA